MSINHLMTQRDRIAQQLAEHEAMIAEARKDDRLKAIEQIKAIMAEHDVTADHLAVKLAAKASKPARKKAETKPGAITYNINGTIYVQGQRGRVPAAVVAAREAGTLDHYRVAA
jgi:DNA-binding protein H-NS